MEQEKRRGRRKTEIPGQEDASAHPRSRGRKRQKRGNPLKTLLLLLLCVILAGAGWGIVRLGQTVFSGTTKETEAVESSREVTPETFPESGAETFL